MFAFKKTLNTHKSYFFYLNIYYNIIILGYLLVWPMLDATVASDNALKMLTLFSVGVAYFLCKKNNSIGLCSRYHQCVYVWYQFNGGVASRLLAAL